MLLSLTFFSPYVPSCRKKDSKWIVAMNRWQDLTDMEVNKGDTSSSFSSMGEKSSILCICVDSLDLLAQYCKYVSFFP
jgi:hypothetical protein